MAIETQDLLALDDALQGQDQGKFGAALDKIKDGSNNKNDTKFEQLNNKLKSSENNASFGDETGKGILATFFKKLFDDKDGVTGSYDDFENKLDHQRGVVTIEPSQQQSTQESTLSNTVSETASGPAAAASSSAISDSDAGKYKAGLVELTKVHDLNITQETDIKFKRENGKFKVVLPKAQYEAYNALAPEKKTEIVNGLVSTIRSVADQGRSATASQTTEETGPGLTTGGIAAHNAVLQGSTTGTPVIPGQGGTGEQITSDPAEPVKTPAELKTAKITAATKIEQLEEISPSPLFSRRGKAIGKEWTQDHGKGDISLGSPWTQERGEIRKLEGQRDGNTNHANKMISSDNVAIEKYLNEHSSFLDNAKGGNLTAFVRKGVKSVFGGSENLEEKDQNAVKELREALKKKDHGNFNAVDTSEGSAIGDFLDNNSNLKELVDKRNTKVSDRDTDIGKKDEKIGVQFEYAQAKVMEKHCLEEYNKLPEKKKVDKDGNDLVDLMVTQEKSGRSSSIPGLAHSLYDSAKGSKFMGSLAEEADSIKPGNADKHKREKGDITPNDVLETVNGFFDKLKEDNGKFIEALGEFRGESGLGSSEFKTLMNKNGVQSDSTSAASSCLDKCPKMMHSLVRERFDAISVETGEVDSSKLVIAKKLGEMSDSYEAVVGKKAVVGTEAVEATDDVEGKKAVVARDAVEGNSKFTDYQAAQEKRTELKAGANAAKSVDDAFGIGRKTAHAAEEIGAAVGNHGSKIAEVPVALAGGVVASVGAAVAEVFTGAVSKTMKSMEKSDLKKALEKGNFSFKDMDLSGKGGGGSDNDTDTAPNTPESSVNGNTEGAPAAAAAAIPDSESGPAGGTAPAANSASAAGDGVGGSSVSSSPAATTPEPERAAVGGGDVDINSANGTGSVSIPAVAARAAREIAGEHLASGSTPSRGEGVISTTTTVVSVEESAKGNSM